MPYRRGPRKASAKKKQKAIETEAQIDAKQSQSDAIVEESPQPSPEPNEGGATVNAPSANDNNYYQDILNFVTRPFSTSKEKSTPSRSDKTSAERYERTLSTTQTPNVERLRERMGSPELGLNDSNSVNNGSAGEEEGLFVESPAASERSPSPVRKRARASDIGPQPSKRQHMQARRETLPARVWSFSPTPVSETGSAKGQIDIRHLVVMDNLAGCVSLVDQLSLVMGKSAWTARGSKWSQTLKPTSHVWRSEQEEQLDSRASQALFQHIWRFSDALAQHELGEKGHFAGNVEASVALASKRLMSSIKSVLDTRLRYSDPNYKAPEKRGVLLSELKTILIPSLVHVLDQFLTAAHEAEKKGGLIVTMPVMRVLLPITKEISRLNFDLQPGNATQVEADNDVGSHDVEQPGCSEHNVTAFWTIHDTLVQSLTNVMNAFNEASAERDQSIRRERMQVEALKQQHKDKQMELFLQSRRESRSQKPARIVPPSTQSMKKEAWQLQEDDIILTMIRRTRRPNIGVLSAMLGDRSPMEVAQRIKYLRGKLRRIFERSNMAPPTWCYDE